MKKSSLLLLFLFLIFFSILIHANQLKSLVPTLDDRSVTITMTFSSALNELDYNIQSNPSKTVYSLTLYGVSGKNMNLPLRAGPVEGLWTRDLGDRMSLSVALLIPANKEPEVLLKNNTLILRFWRSAIEVSVDRFSTYSMNLQTVLTYLFSDEVLNLSHVITEKVGKLPVTVGFTSSHPEDILRNILISLGSQIAYAYLTDGTFYIGTPEEVKDVVNRFWKTYIGVDIKVGEDGQNQLEAIRKALPVEAFLEYIPNESTLLAFGDLETHLLLSNLLTSSYIKKEYNVELLKLPSGEKTLDYFYKIASEVNNFLCDGSVKIDSLPEFNKLILSGSARDVNIIISYLDSYKKSLQKDLEQSKPKILTVKLPDNFKIVEDVINRNRTEKITLASLIESLLSNYIPGEQLQVDRTFESLGKITLTFPEAMTDIVNEILRDITLRSQTIGYRILRDTAPIDNEIIMQIEDLTGVIIESLGENNGYIIKGEKNKLDIAEYLISQFTEASHGKLARRFIEIKTADAFDSVKNFLEHFFATEGLKPEQYTIDAIAERLVFISAPEEALERALQELGKYEKVFFPETGEYFIEIPENVYESGIKDLISTLYTGKIDYTYIPSIEILIARGNKNDLISLQNLIKQMTPKIESHLGLKTSPIEERKISKLIKSLPGWDDEKFNTYLESYLGEEAYKRIKIIPTTGGYLVIGDETTVKVVENEIERLRELENPYYLIVERLPRIEQFNDLLLRMGITVEIFPVNSKYILAGTRDNVLQARNLINQIEMGIPAETTEGTTTSTIVFSFVDIPEDSIEAIQAIITKLGINVEIMQSPTGPLLIGTSNEVKRATEVIESVLSKRREEVEKTVNKGYAILPKLANLDLGTVKTIASSFSYNLNIIEAAGKVIVIGTQKDVEDFIPVYKELESDGEGKLLTLDKKVAYSELENVIKTLGFSVSIVETQHKIIVFGNPEDVAAIQRLVSELAPEDTEPATTDVLPPKKDIAVLTNVNIETDKLSALLNDMPINVKLYSFNNGLAIIGYPEEIQKAKEIVQHLSGLPSPKTNVYKYIETTEPMNQEFLRTAATSLDLQVTFLFIKENGIIVVGSREDVESMVEFINGLQSQIKEEEFSYALVSRPGIDITNLEQIFEGLGLNLTVHELPDSLVLIGSRADLKKAKSFLEQIQFSSQESAEGTKTTYSLINIPEGFTTTDIQTIVRKIGINVETIPAGTAALLVGEESAITDAKGVISTLSALGKKPAELVEYSYKIITLPIGVTPQELSTFFETIGLNLKTLEISGYVVLVGTDEDIAKGEEAIKALAPKETAEATPVKKEYTTISVPEGFTLESLQTVLRKIGIEVDITVAGDVVVMVGEAESLAKATEVITRLHGLNKRPQISKIEYAVLEAPIGLDLNTVKEALNALNVAAQILKTDDKLIVIGTSGEIEETKNMIELLKPEITEEATKVEEKTYTLVNLPEGLSIEQLQTITRKIGIKTELVGAANTVLVVGSKTEIQKAQNVIATLAKLSTKPEEMVKLSYKIEERETTLTVNELNELLKKVGIAAEGIEVSGKFVLIGPEEEITKAEEVLVAFEKDTPEATETKKVYELVNIPEGFTTTDIQTIVRKIGIDVETIPAGTAALLVGGESAITDAKGVISTLSALGKKPAELVEYSYKVFERPGQIALATLRELLTSVGLDVKAIEIGNSLILIGTDSNISKAIELLDSLKVDSAETGHQELEYSIVELPENIDPDQLEKVLEVLQISARILQLGDFMIVTGDATNLADAERLIKKVVDSAQATETTVVSNELSYKLITLPPGSSLDELSLIAKTLELKLKIQPIGNQVLIAGDLNEIEYIQDIIEKTAVPEKPEGQSNVKLLQKLPGIDADTLKKYLLSKGIAVSDVFDVDNGYLIFGSDSAVEQAQQLTNYLADSTKRSYEFVEVPENISEELLNTLADSLMMDIGITKVSENTFLISGKTEQILKFKETLSGLYSLKTGTLAYRIIKKPGIQLQQLEEIFSGLDLRVKLLETEQNLVIIGKENDIERANKLIEELTTTYNTSAATETNIVISELPRLPGWTLEQITEYLKAADISLRSLFAYGDKVIGVGFVEQLERAKELLNFLAKDQKTDFTKIEKSLATAEQLQSVVDSMDVSVNIIELENAWLLIGNKNALDKIKGIIEGALTEEKDYQSYIYNVTNVSTELELFMEATFPQVETRVFKNLGVIVLKSKDQEALAKAEKLIKQIQSKDVEISPEDNFMVKDGLIYVYAENANLVAVMKRIAKSLGISLMVPEELDETFTLTLEGVTWDTFVAAIQECEPVKIEKVNDIYIVRKKEIVSEAPTDDATGEQIYRVYHNIEKLKTLIEFYGGTVYADSVNGILVVKGLPKSRVLELMEQVSGTFTSPKKQVNIETRIVDKSLLDDITKQFSTSLGFEQPNILFNSGSLNLSFSILDSVDFAKLLKNLITGSATVTAQLEKSNVDGSIISNPSIVALSGEEARIHIGDTIPILLKKIDPATGNIVEELQYLETGVEMTITPTVKDDGTILLDLYIKVSEPQPYANDLYGEKTREAKTKLVISDGNTLTIGGLVSERENVSVTKLPFFGDLPFIGKLFRAEKTTKEQREMVIFITAMVVEP
ncbi:type II and III secretion system protein [Kosmotoga sp.]|uniref:type II secretion system protein GspD n=1 Tax=Kosmotoga sp. TaxID=1955248 RepID=UPI0024AA7FD2|nr:type II and III secretion system protein [Kosmotoga sp.]MDI3523327.1 hypothetical protein [Kosmotoga sp.]MDK2953549.1 hypothetical protein [Kosmotoga sp.]